MSEAVDVFVSYAHSDDEVPEGAAQGWVSTLKNELQKVLRRRLGGSGARIWMDHELAANQGVTHELLTRVGAARTLVLVLSPGYLRSDWCQRELANFVARAQAAGRADCIFPVEIDELDRSRWHPALQSLTPLRFWTREAHELAPRLAGYPKPKADEDSLYWRHVNELGHLIAKRLDAAPQAGAAAPARKATVLLAETTDDLDEQRDQVAAALRQRGDAVVLLPAADYPRGVEADFVAAVQQDLKASAFFVQLLGQRPGKRPSQGELSYTALQAREAEAALLARAHHGHGPDALRLLQWLDPQVNLDAITDPAYRQLLAQPRVQRSGGFEEFRLGLLQALDAWFAPPPAPPVPMLAGAAAAKVLGMPPVAGQLGFAGSTGLAGLAVDGALGDVDASGLSLYVQAAPEDREHAERIADHLADAGAAVLTSPDPAPGRSWVEALREQEEALRLCHGVLFVYGHSPVAAVTTAFQYALRVFGMKRREVWSAVLDLPPSEKPRLPLRSPNLVTLPCRTGFDPAQLGPFFNGLRQALAVQDAAAAAGVAAGGGGSHA